VHLPPGFTPDERDPEMLATYAAEWPFHRRGRVVTHDDVRVILRKVWADVGEQTIYTVPRVTQAKAWVEGWSLARVKRARGKPSRRPAATIQLDEQVPLMVALHEVSHVLASFDMLSLARPESCDYGFYFMGASHGRLFRATFVEVVRRYDDSRRARRLADAFVRRGLRV